MTGSADYLARIWNPYVTQKNIAILEGHHAAVIDVKINERLGQCYTFSKDAVRIPISYTWFFRSFDTLTGGESLGSQGILLSSNDFHSISEHVRWEDAGLRSISDGSLFK